MNMTEAASDIAASAASILEVSRHVKREDKKS
jgi:hypothetical protein